MSDRNAEIAGKIAEKSNRYMPAEKSVAGARSCATTAVYSDSAAKVEGGELPETRR